MSGNKIVECVPNFSEGRNNETITAITSAIKSTEGCTLLDVDPGVSTNRTVVTFVGNPDSVVQGALAAARVAYRTIDMTKHHGEITWIKWSILHLVALAAQGFERNKILLNLVQ